MRMQEFPAAEAATGERPQPLGRTEAAPVTAALLARSEDGLAINGLGEYNSALVCPHL